MPQQDTVTPSQWATFLHAGKYRTARNARLSVSQHASRYGWSEKDKTQASNAVDNYFRLPGGKVEEAEVNPKAKPAKKSAAPKIASSVTVTGKEAAPGVVTLPPYPSVATQVALSLAGNHALSPTLRERVEAVLLEALKTPRLPAR